MTATVAFPPALPPLPALPALPEGLPPGSAGALPVARSGVALPLPVEAAADLTLSATASLIASLLDDGGSEPAPVFAAAPLQPQADAPAPALAHALRQAVADSGLFYESHLAAFAQGLLAREQVARAPQAALAARLAAETLATTGSVAAAPVAGGAAAPAGADAVAHPLAAIGAPLLPLVQQQLHLLATGVFRWSGEAWPGVPMRWTIEREPASPDDAAQGPLDRWSTCLTVELPALGPVEVRLSLCGARLHAQVATTDRAAQPLQRESDALRDDLARHGFATRLDIATREGRA